MNRTVSVFLQFPDKVPRTLDATIYVRVEDVSEADAPARMVAQEVLRGVRLPKGSGLQAEVQVPEELVSAKAHYNVRVHVDRKGDGRVGAGDLVSTQSHPVLTFERASSVTVPLKLVP